MTGRMLPLASLLMVAGCGKVPTSHAGTAVRVVSGAVSASRTAEAVRPAAVPRVIARSEVSHDPPTLLTVEESARIRTPEMWSEPLTPAG